MLQWNRTADGAADLAVHATPGTVARLESSEALEESWGPWQDVFVGAEPAHLRIPLDPSMKHFFVRPAPAQGIGEQVPTAAFGRTTAFP